VQLVVDLPPADWYSDPEDPDQYRYWDGSQWTEHRAPRHSGASVASSRSRHRSSDRLAGVVLVVLSVFPEVLFTIALFTVYRDLGGESADPAVSP